MRYKSLKRSAGASCLTAAVLLAATAAVAWKNPLQDRYTAGPLDICDVGAFFVGGVPKVTNYSNSAVSAGAPIGC